MESQAFRAERTTHHTARTSEVAEKRTGRRQRHRRTALWSSPDLPSCLAGSGLGVVPGLRLAYSVGLILPYEGLGKRLLLHCRNVIVDK